MPYLYEKPKDRFHSFNHFKEVAIKISNEQYGRVRPLDVFDFSETEGVYRAVAYREGEEIIPRQTKEGGVVDSAEAEKAREAEEENKENAEAEIVAERARLINVIEQGGELSEEDKLIALNLGLIDADCNPLIGVDPKFASEAAKQAAEDAGIDAKLITGTGNDGRITKADVVAFVKAREDEEKVAQSTDAPEQENANDQNGIDE